MDILFGSLTAVLFGSITIATVLALRVRPDALSGAAAMTFLALLLVAPLAAASVAWSGGAVGGLWRFAIAGFISPGIGQIVFTHAARDAGAARVGIVLGTSPVLAGLLAIVLLDEPFRVTIAVATAMIVVGGAVVMWDSARREHSRRIGLLFAALAALTFAVQANVLRWASQATAVKPLLGVATMLAVGTLTLFAYAALSRGRDAYAGVRAALRPFAAPGLALAVGYVVYTLAYKHGRVTLVAPLVATQSLWTVILAALLIGIEREAIGVRLVGALVLVVGGAVLIGVSA